jgi:hypothetical protein
MTARRIALRAVPFGWKESSPAGALTHPLQGESISKTRLRSGRVP